MTGSRPVVGVISDRRMVTVHPFHMSGEKYLQALVTGAHVFPLAIPAALDGLQSVEVLERLDGLFLTGSPSNMAPHHYGGTLSREDTWLDPERDSVALELIPAAVEQGVPLMVVCRGFQELNVAYGGTLHQHVHDVPGFRIHKENPDDPLDVQYGPSHAVTFTPGGVLAGITGVAGARVNSLHSQGIDRLGDGLAVEALADDGLVEAVVVRDAPGFTLGVQWHPEWKVSDDPVSMAIFRAFGEACGTFAG
jgi:putative glutamine amidotransferase